MVVEILRFKGRIREFLFEYRKRKIVFSRLGRERDEHPTFPFVIEAAR